jgi:hypothetical protein
MRSVSPRTALAIRGLACLIIIVSLTGSAQALEVDMSDFSGPSFPGGSAAMANVTVSYECGTLLADPLGDAIELTVETEGPGVSSINPTSFEVQSVPDCTAGQAVTESATLTYVGPRTALAGATATITVTVTGSGLTASEEAEDSGEAIVGPYLDIIYAAVNSTYQARAGDTVTMEIRITSESNVETMTMPSITAPEGWPRPDASPVTVASPFTDGASGEGILRFDVTVPADAAEGNHTFNAELFAHNVGEPVIETGKVNVPLTLRILPPPEDPNERDSPAPAAALLLTLLAAAMASRRRT